MSCPPHLHETLVWCHPHRQHHAPASQKQHYKQQHHVLLCAPHCPALSLLLPCCRERVDDPRYRDFAWLRFNRRWPPKLYKSLDAFLQLKSLPAL